MPHRGGAIIGELRPRVTGAARCLWIDRKTAQRLSYLFISHDLGVIHHVADRVLVMRSGRVVESGTAAEIFDNAQDPYTQQLLASLPLAAPQPALGGPS